MDLTYKTNNYYRVEALETTTTKNVDAVFAAEGVNRLFVLQTDDQNSLLVSKISDYESVEMVLDLQTDST